MHPLVPSHICHEGYACFFPVFSFSATISKTLIHKCSSSPLSISLSIANQKIYHNQIWSGDKQGMVLSLFYVFMEDILATGKSTRFANRPIHVEPLVTQQCRHRSGVCVCVCLCYFARSSSINTHHKCGAEKEVNKNSFLVVKVWLEGHSQVSFDSVGVMHAENRKMVLVFFSLSSVPFHSRHHIFIHIYLLAISSTDISSFTGLLYIMLLKRGIIKMIPLLWDDNKI